MTHVWGCTYDLLTKLVSLESNGKLHTLRRLLRMSGLGFLSICTQSYRTCCSCTNLLEPGV